MSTQPQQEGSRSILTWLALIVAGVATAGSLYLSIGMGLLACPLCFYQRTFVMGALGVLVIGLLTRMDRLVSLSALAFPLAVGGLGIAGLHVYLEGTGKMECPAGILGVGSAPQQSLAALGILALLLVLDLLTSHGQGSGVATAVAGLVLGGAFAYGCFRGSPPAVRPSAEAYKEEPKGCRPLPRPD
jgi:disulfide bond formation protein DsbB